MAKVVKKAETVSALVVVDLVNDFVTGVFGNERAFSSGFTTEDLYFILIHVGAIQENALRDILMASVKY